jgi:prepilin-type N-terminal cleavage/methylation domain-containing protein
MVMGGMRAALRALRSDGAGFTLPELLIATVLSLIVIGGAVMAFTASMSTQPRLSSQSAGIQQARTTMERMTRELRQGSTVPSASASQLSIVTYVNSATCGGSPAAAAIQCRVTYSCSSGTCTRTEAKPDGSAPGPVRQVVSGLSSNSVFTYTPPTPTAPAYVSVTLSLPPQGANQGITLSDGVALRNPSGS